MKNSTSFFVILFIFLTSISSTDPSNSNLLLITGMGISVSLNDVSQKKIFSNAEYSNEYEVVLMETERLMEYIQILNNKGALERQIHVGSKTVEIEKGIFQKGKYLMGLKIKGQPQLEFVNVEID